MKKSINVLLILIIGLNILNFIKTNIGLYTKPFNPGYYKDLYGGSQYVRTDPINILPDENVYSYAAWEYMQGTNPAVFNADQPPLGKYFIGLGEKYFNNERLSGPIFNILSLIALYFLANLVLKNSRLSLLLTVLFSLEKLFMVQMLYAPLLDNIQLFFILLGFIFYIKSLKNRQFLIYALLTLGMVMAVKFWVTGVVIYAIWLVHSLFLKDIKRIIQFILLTPLVAISLLATYIPSFFEGSSIKTILGVQKYIFEFHKGKLHLDPSAVWDLLLFNRWHVPWDGTIRGSVDWQWTWPLLAILSLIAIFKTIKIKKGEEGLSGVLGLMVIWFISYFFLLSVGAVLSRYLIPVLPAMYILSFWPIKKFLDRIQKNN